jgi:hypothetical protein
VVAKERRYIEHLRGQADRCYRYAEQLGDRDFAAKLLEIARDLDAEADLREAELAQNLPRSFRTCLRRALKTRLFSRT